MLIFYQYNFDFEKINKDETQLMCLWDVINIILIENKKKMQKEKWKGRQTKENIQSKWMCEAISKYNYYVDILYPTLFTKNQDCSLFNLKSIKKDNNIIYFYGELEVENIDGIGQRQFQKAFCYHYLLNHDVVKIKSSYLKKTFFHPPVLSFNLKSQAVEMIQLFTDVQTKSSKNSKVLKQDKMSKNKFQAYICHFYTQSQNLPQIKWNNFIEKFEIVEGKLYYRVACSAISEGFWKGNDNLLYQFVSGYCSSQSLTKFIGYLLQARQTLQHNLKEDHSNDPAFSENHIRLRKIPPQNYQTFTKLREQLPQSLADNTICRFLIANNYSYEQTRQKIGKYKTWVDNIQKKYTLQDFSSLIQQDIFTYLGEDHQGRPVILNKAANVRVDEIDADLYCDYYLYWLEIFLVKKMRGYVDQFVIIADVKNLSMANFKFAITKRNVSDCLLYCPERQFKLIAVHPAFFGFYCYKILKTILPQKTVSKVVVLGNQKKQILQFILTQMNIDVIPTYLGGNNPLGSQNEQF